MIIVIFKICNTAYSINCKPTETKGIYILYFVLILYALPNYCL